MRFGEKNGDRKESGDRSDTGALWLQPESWREGVLALATANPQALRQGSPQPATLGPGGSSPPLAPRLGEGTVTISLCEETASKGSDRESAVSSETTKSHV